MKFFLDENIPSKLADPLSVVYRDHQFGTTFSENMEGVLDLELFEVIRSRGYDAIITKDGAQLNNPDERRAIFDQGLHWIGHKMKRHPGTTGFALESSTVVAGLAYVLQDWRHEPHAYLLKGLPSDLNQRMSLKPLRPGSWN